MTSVRNIQLSVAAFLLTYTIYIYLTKPDWWIYGWLTGISGILLALHKPTCPYWRFLTSVVIVFGTIETLFLAWSVHHVEKAALLGERTVLPEGRNVLITAIATSASISSRLRSAECNGLIDVTRGFILIGSLIVLAPTILYSSCFYVSNTAICHVFH